MRRVLVTGASNIGKAGVATIVYKWGQHFDENVCIYDYLMQNGLPDEKYVAAIKNKGGRIFTMREPKSYLQIIKWVTSVVHENNYETIHINSDSAYIAAAYIYAAKRGGIKNIYVHSHCTKIDDSNIVSRYIKTLLHYLCRFYVKKNTNLYLACSSLAGDWMFGKHIKSDPKYKLICNGVEVKDYVFNEEYRDKYRLELNLKDKIVIGNVGRISFQKNHEYLIKLFAEYHKENNNSILVIVGMGDLYDAVRNQVCSLNLENSVLFLGQRNDVDKLLSAMDVLVMPSRFEGLPVTMIEAQMASLPCIVSDTITTEADFSGLVTYLKLGDYYPWVDAIREAVKIDRPIDTEILEHSDFNIEYAAYKLQRVLIGNN